MRNLNFSSLALPFVVLVLLACPVRSIAYQGFGTETPGGSGKPVYRVTNLNDFGSGSLRDAVSKGNRDVVFDVAGEIFLSDHIQVRGSFITIDGFTAPAPGITLKNRGLYIRGNNGAHDIIVRGIRVREAIATSSTDCIQVAWGAYNIVIDRVSTYGCADGGIDVTESAHDVTISWSILAEPLSGHNMLISNNPSRVTLHHNLFVKGISRNPQVRMDVPGTPASDTTVDMRNNLIWDWNGGFGTRVWYGPRVNVVNNFYDSTTGAADALIVCPGPECTTNEPASAARVYASGNISGDGINLDARGNVNQPFPAPAVDTQDARTAACHVISEAGVRPLDSIDEHYLSQISLSWCADKEPTQSSSLPPSSPSPSPAPPPPPPPPPPTTSQGIIVDRVATTSSQMSVGNTVSWSHTVSGNDRLLIVAMMFKNNDDQTVSSVTYGGAHLAKIGHSANRLEVRSELWLLIAPTTGTHTVTATFDTANTNSGMVGASIGLTGVHQTTPVGTLVSAAAATNSPTVNIKSATNELVIHSLAVRESQSVTTGPGQTQQWNVNDSSDVTGFGSTEHGAATVTMSAALGVSTEWAQIGVSIKPAAVLSP